MPPPALVLSGLTRVFLPQTQARLAPDLGKTCDLSGQTCVHCRRLLSPVLRHPAGRTGGLRRCLPRPTAVHNAAGAPGCRHATAGIPF
ncbi:hypothetical protein, partial [Photorhabdus sp. RM96S]|uniref:hypothetical protein n=1 Tax=Photorhabdus sp. RM96S TaxID=3342822 RepID=UPI0036D9C40F